MKTNTSEASENVNIAFNSGKSHVLLPTAVIQVVGNGVTLSCRALFDTGAQANLITESCGRKLNLKQEHLNVKVSGIGGNVNWRKCEKIHLVFISLLKVPKKCQFESFSTTKVDWIPS